MGVLRHWVVRRAHARFLAGERGGLLGAGVLCVVGLLASAELWT